MFGCGHNIRLSVGGNYLAMLELASRRVRVSVVKFDGEVDKKGRAGVGRCHFRRIGSFSMSLR